LIIASIAIVAYLSSAGPVPKQVDQLLLVNLTSSDREANITSIPGIISYGASFIEERVLLMPYSLIELDSNYVPVANRLGAHYIPTLNSTTWTLGDAYSLDLDGVLCTGVNMTARLSNHARLLVRVLLFEEDGVVSSNLDQFNVTAGTLKVDFFVRQWSFCNSRSSRRGCLARGDYLQVDIALKPLTDIVDMISNNTYLIGPETILITNPEVEVDNEIYEMEQGYPLLLEANSTSIFPQEFEVANNYTTDFVRIWIPRFRTYALWDSIIF
jgi:hypothetical protein